nr:DHHA1 domain-containing protein [bacterium]
AFLNRGSVIEKYDPPRHDSLLARCDAVAMVDCCDFYRLGRLETAAKTVPGPVVNIDHHRDNGFFGAVNYVRFSAGGAAQLVFETLKAMGVAIAGQIAEALYVGLSTDTVNFRYIDPEGRMIGMLGELVEAGIDIELLQERLYCSNRDTYLDDLYAILRSVSYERDGNLAWFTLYRSEHLSFYQRELASEALKQLLSLERVRAAVMMHEENAGVEVWLRSKRDADVGSAAKVLGGGGHQTAAGALLRGARLEEAIPRVLEEVSARMGARP